MHESDRRDQPDKNIPYAPSWGDEDDPAPHPVLRRAFRIAYIVIVVLVITGLILLLFPWRPRQFPFPFDLPWQTIQIMLPLT